MSKTPLWTDKDAACATQGRATAPFAATGVSIDTRTLKQGDLFVALIGENSNGHDFVEAAFKAGAAAAVVQNDFSGKSEKPLLHVQDTMTALENLGRAARARSHALVIGVAGSVGKTGTKEMLATLFGALGKTHASEKSYNNHLGVPLSLSRMPQDTEFGVFEIGMNHPGEITGLAKQTRPDIALITTIDREHVAFFPNGLDGIADANAEIFDGMTQKDGGRRIAVLNCDNPYFDRLAAAARAQGLEAILGFGEEEEADARLTDCALRPDGSSVSADILGTAVKFRLNIPGKHIVQNALGALCVVAAAGEDVHRAAKALEKSTPVAGRGNRYTLTLTAGTAPVIVIDESYNANPASMVAAFDVFGMVAPQEGGRRIAVLGDMLELGRDGPRLHAELVNPLLRARTDLVFCCGILMDALYQDLPDAWRGAHEKDSKDLAARVAETVKPGDVVLVKGSLGSKMAYVIEALQAREADAQKENRHAL